MWRILAHMTVTLTTLQFVVVAVRGGCCRQARRTHDSARVPRRLIQDTRYPGVRRLRGIGPTAHPLGHRRRLVCPKVNRCCSTCLRVCCQDPTLIFDLERAHDQNRRRLFKRLKFFTIINQTFDREEGVIQTSASTCLAAHSRWEEARKVAKVGPTSLLTSRASGSHLVCATVWPSHFITLRTSVRQQLSEAHRPYAAVDQ